MSTTTQKTIDMPALLAALDAYEDACAAYEAALERGEKVEPPTPVDHTAYITITTTVAQTGKGAPLPDRPDPMGVAIFEDNMRIMDEFCAAADTFARLSDKMLKGFYIASLPENRPAKVAQPANFHDFVAWVPRRNGVDAEGAKVLRYTHESGIAFDVTVPDLLEKTKIHGSADLAIIQLAKDELNRLNEPARRYNEVNRDIKRYLTARLVTAHGEEMAKKLFTVPRADNARAAALVDKDQAAKLREAEKAAKLAADLKAIQALAGDDVDDDVPVIDAEAPAGEEIAQGVILNAHGVDMGAAKAALSEFFADKPADKPAPKGKRASK